MARAACLLAWGLISLASIWGVLALPAWALSVLLLIYAAVADRACTFLVFSTILFAPTAILPWGLFGFVIAGLLPLFLLTQSTLSIRTISIPLGAAFALLLVYALRSLGAPNEDLALVRTLQVAEVAVITLTLAATFSSRHEASGIEETWVFLVAASLVLKLVHMELGEATALYHVADQTTRRDFGLADRIVINIGGTMFPRLIYPGQEPNYTSTLLLFPAALAFRLLHQSLRNGSTWQRCAYLACAVSISAQILGTFSRSGALCLLLIVTYFLMKSLRRSAIVPISVSAALALFVWFYAGVLERFTSIQDAVHDGASGRFDYWRVAIDLLSEYPLLGAGTGAFQSLVGDAAHNSYFEAAVDFGLIGLLAYVVFLAVPVATLLRYRRSVPQSGFYLVGFVASLAMIGTLTLHDLKLLAIPGVYICWVVFQKRSALRRALRPDGDLTGPRMSALPAPPVPAR